jgi:FG-GAP repeat protein
LKAVAVLLVSAVLIVDGHAQTLKQTAYIKPSNTRGGEQFGAGGTLLGDSVAISGDGTTLAVGAPMEDSGAKGINGNQADESAFDSGAVYVFARNGNTWRQQAYIKPSNTHHSSNFGYVVRLSGNGNTLAVSAYFEASNATGINGNQNDDSIPQAGAVYVFTRTGTTWTQQAYIKASNTGEAGKADEIGDGDQFGFSIALSADGNTLAAGAIGEDSNATGVNGNQADNSVQNAGAVYVFSRTGTTWSQQAYVKPANPGPDAGDLFGYAVSLTADGNMLAIGSYDEDGPDNKTNGTGAVYVYARNGTTWSQQAYLRASNAEPGDSLGVSVAISLDGTTIASGALDEDCLCTGVNPPGGDNDRALDTSAGAVYVFVRQGNMWSQQAYIKASNSGKEDWFGSRLAMSGDGNTLAVGAQLEDSAATGINGKQNDDSAQESGAVYIFTRNGTTWAQRYYVKGSNTEKFDEFGSSTSLSRDGKIIAIGARNEASSAKGINGNQADNSAAESGAVYIFEN